jgi:PAS domain S-box-containing protein
MSLRSICSLVLARALELTHTNTGFIVLKDTDDLMIAAESGYPPMSLNAARISISLTGTVLESAQAIRYNDLRTEQTAPPLMKTTRSQLTVPILRGTETLGAITLESDFTRSFSEEDTHFVTQLANQTTIAIDNTRLFERIAEARDQLQVILNAMTEAIVLIDKTGRIALANPRVEILGLVPKTLLNQEVDDLLERPDLDLAERMGFQSDQKVRKLIKELRTPGAWVGVDTASYTVENEQGDIYVQREVIPIRAEDGEPLGMLLVFYDETEQKEIIRMRDDLSSMIVHDLRSPLTAVTTGLKLLRDFVPPDSTFRPLVESTTDTSQRAIRKLLSRVDSLLDISKLESGQISLDTEPTELATLADSVCMELSPLAHELEVTVTSQINGEMSLLDIDADKVERVLQNLVDNALKFCPANGSVTICSHAPGTNGAEPGFARIDVIDTGPGVPDEYKSRLFERFVQVKGRRGARRGIGLGLTFCRLVTEAHGGRIWIEDNPVGGSIFAFTLPVANLIDPNDTTELPAVRE